MILKLLKITGFIRGELKQELLEFSWSNKLFMLIKYWTYSEVLGQGANVLLNTVF